MPEVLPTIREVRGWLGPNQRLEVDGGISPQTIGEAAKAGADVFVAGTAIFGVPDRDFARAVADLRSAADAGARPAGPKGEV